MNYKKSASLRNTGNNAIDEWHLPACRYLIEKGANINEHIESGSVLMFAVASGNQELVSFLLHKGADAKWKNHQGETARAMSQKEDMIKLLPK